MNKFVSAPPPSRGFRNNNPFNIILSKHPWIGKFDNNTDGVFEQFCELKYGIRAGVKLLINYINKGYNTPRKIIHRFAPSHENDIRAYCKYISVSLPLDVRITNCSQLVKLCVAICDFENGIHLLHKVRSIDVVNVIREFKLNTYNLVRDI